MLVGRRNKKKHTEYDRLYKKGELPFQQIPVTTQIINASQPILKILTSQSESQQPKIKEVEVQ